MGDMDFKLAGSREGITALQVNCLLFTTHLIIVLDIKLSFGDLRVLFVIG